jgi:hypothetical protein
MLFEANRQISSQSAKRLEALSHKRVLAIASAILIAIGLVGAPVVPLGAQGFPADDSRRELAALLPTSDQVPLLLYDRLSSEQRRVERAIYDSTRARMIAADIDPVFASDVLAVLADGAGDRFRARAQFVVDPLHHPRPALAKLLCDRQALDAIRVSVDKEQISRLDPPRRTPSASADPDADIVIPRPRPEASLARVARDMFNQVQLPDYLGHRCPDSNADYMIRHAPRWKMPVRIAATGLPDTDAMIASALAEIRRQVPNAPIDAGSFPAPATAANLFVTAQGGADVLNRCFDAGACSSLRGLIDARASTALTRERNAFLARTYFTLPYHRYAAEDAALVELSPAGDIAGALCVGSIFRDPVSQSRLTLCLAQALGAFPAAGPAESDAGAPESAARFNAVIESAIPQLLVLYP